MKKGKKSKPTKAKEDSDPNDDDFVSDEDLNNILRSLTVIYGFFFVFISAMVAGSQVLSVTLVDSSASLVFFGFIFLLSMACSMIGLEIFMILNHLGISFVGEWGIRILIALVPAVFTFIIGYTVLSDMVIYGLSLPPFGFWLVSYVQVFLTILIYFKMKRDLNQNEKESPKTTPKKK
ncbi:MAG: hypothetical protein RTV72_05865 [Candidatus Thorarchaeota archaeon]